MTEDVVLDLLSWLETFEGVPEAFDSDSEEEGQARYERFHEALEGELLRRRNELLGRN